MSCAFRHASDDKRHALTLTVMISAPSSARIPASPCMFPSFANGESELKSANALCCVVGVHPSQTSAECHC